MANKNDPSDSYVKGRSGVPDDHSNVVSSFYHKIGVSSQPKSLPINGNGFGILIACGVVIWLFFQPIEWSLNNKYELYAKATIYGNGDALDRGNEYFTHYITENTKVFLNDDGKRSAGYFNTGKCVRKLAEAKNRAQVEVYGKRSSGKRVKRKYHIDKKHILPILGRQCRAVT